MTLTGRNYKIEYINAVTYTNLWYNMTPVLNDGIFATFSTILYSYVMYMFKFLVNFTKMMACLTDRVAQSVAPGGELNHWRPSVISVTMHGVKYRSHEEQKT